MRPGDKIEFAAPVVIIDPSAFDQVVRQRNEAIKERDQARACARVHRRALKGDTASLALCQAPHALPDWLIEGIG